MQAVKKIFSHDDDKRSSSDSTAEVGNTGSLAHNNGTAAHNSHNTSGSSSDRNMLESGVGGAGSHGEGVHSQTLAKAHDGENGSLSHKHNVGEHANVPGENASHDHRHLAAVTKEKLHHHTTEEVSREREVDRHVHHVQQHVQPVLDTQHADREHSEKVHAPTHIHEQHVNTDGDKKIFAGLNTHKESVAHGQDSHKVVDKGEVVHENTSHHVHHVVQPVIERDTHTHHTVHTTIPIQQTTHEAPIIHQSSTHEPMHLKDFVAGGGDIKSNLTHDKAGVLADGDCARDVEGPGEKLAAKLHLGGASHHGAAGNPGSTDQVGSAGISGAHAGATGGQSGLTGQHTGGNTL